jgi:hypothetical protein
MGTTTLEVVLGERTIQQRIVDKDGLVVLVEVALRA